MTEPVKAKYRNYPTHRLEIALGVGRMIRDHMAGKPMNRLLLADALKIKPSSSNFRTLLSSSLKYGLTIGTEKADEIALTELGHEAVSGSNQAALRRAAMTPPVFGKFYADYNNNKIPTLEMLAKILVAKYDVPERAASECSELIILNGEWVGLVREIAGSPHILLNAGDGPDIGAGSESHDPDIAQSELDGGGKKPTVSTTASDSAELSQASSAPDSPGSDRHPKSIFLGHGRKTGPREKLERILREFKIPFAVAVTEPNLGKPIPTKVRETLLSCGSAILIFTKDQKFLVEDGDGGLRELWRPSENVVHELGAASLLYEDRIVIFKERGIDLPSNFSSIGYIEFEEDGIEAKTIDLLKELIGFGLVMVSPVP